MITNILIVEDEFIIANDLRLILTKAGYQVCGIATSVEEAHQLIEEEKPGWVMLDIYLQDGYHGTDLALYLNQCNIGFMYISANTDQATLEAVKETHPYGFVVKPFREKDLLIMLDIAAGKHQTVLDQLAVKEMNWKRELALLINDADSNNKAERIAGTFQAFIPFDYLQIEHWAWNQQVSGYHFQRTGFDEYQVSDTSKIKGKGYAAPGRPSRAALRDPFLPEGIYNGAAYQQCLEQHAELSRLSKQHQHQSRCTCTLVNNENDKIQLSFFSKHPHSYTAAHVNLLQKHQAALLQLLRRVHFQPAKKATLRGQPTPCASPAGASQPFASVQAHFPGITGTNAAMLHLFDQIDLVAPTSTSVLITGESGTGKERVAKSIHALSQRSTQPLVVVNCAALPGELIESELFGHEKGSFTGAADRRIGKFELAQGGTIFLDEIGELSAEAQVKFLRVLQEKEIERVGGGIPIPVDVRVIAATNRNLEQEVAQGRFRLDLYYRLNVYPVTLPPLRHHAEDIVPLATQFVQTFAARLQRPITGIAPQALDALVNYHWPGNIRELEHIIERSCISTREGDIQNVQLPVQHQPASAPTLPAGTPLTPVKKLEEMEAAYIIQVLKSCNGKIAGAGGAAAILGLPATTLHSRIKKLGITKNQWLPG